MTITSAAFLFGERAHEASPMKGASSSLPEIFTSLAREVILKTFSLVLSAPFNRRSVHPGSSRLCGRCEAVTPRNERNGT